MIEVRNTLIHFKPEWNSVHSPYTSAYENQNKLTDKLVNKFEVSVFFKNTGNAIFPGKCIGYGCGKWFLVNVLRFADEFHNKISLKPVYEHISKTIELEYV